MSDLLFAVPWWLPTLLALIGVVLLINGNKTQTAKVRNAGAGLIALAIAWALLSYFVDTDKEKVEKGTREFVQAGVAGDWAKFKSSMTSTAVITTSGHTNFAGADLITEYARTTTQLIQLKSARIQNLVLEQTGPLISARCDVFSTQESYAPVETTSWQFDWEQTSGGWKIREVRLIALHGVASEDLRDIIPRK